jgi:hypothetical protein
VETHAPIKAGGEQLVRSDGLISAAIDFNPDKAVGLDGALAKVDHGSYGPLLLSLIAAGLIAFGIYSLSDARFRRI